MLKWCYGLRQHCVPRELCLLSVGKKGILFMKMVKIGLGGIVGLLMVALGALTFAQQQGDLKVKPIPSSKVAELYERSWAVLVGVNDFASAKVPQLHYAVNDVQAVATTLKNLGFPSDQIFILQNEKATRRAIERVLSSTLFRKTGPNDRVLIFFSTHGVTVPLSGEREEGFLMPHDGDLRTTCRSPLLVCGSSKPLGSALRPNMC